MSVYVVKRMKDIWADCVDEYQVVGVFSSPELAASASCKSIQDFVHVEKFKYWEWSIGRDASYIAEQIIILECEIDTALVFIEPNA